MSDTRLLLADQTLEQLRAKLRNPSPVLAPLWKHLRILAKNDPWWFSSYNVLAFLVTGEEPYRANARNLFLRFIENEPHSLLTWEVQLHTHVVAAPQGRLAVLFDWIADTDLLTADEQAAFCTALQRFAFGTPFQQLQGRARAFDNQILSNAFGAALAGYVTGRRRGDEALGRRLLAVGTEWIEDQFTRLPSSCYSGEGSTYHQLIVEPILTLAGLFLEETQGLPLYDRGIPPASSPLRDWMRMARDLLGPHGIMPGWDAYGLFHGAVKAPLVYYARRERDPAPLALVRDADMWYTLAHVAWDFDDRLWSLVWWPDDLEPGAPYAFQPWMNHEAAAALQTDRVRLFQYWDECGGAPHCGRPNADPNALQFDVDGLPLLLDGQPGIPSSYLNATPEDILGYLDRSVFETMLTYRGREVTEENLRKVALDAVGGSVGESNVLVLDGEDWYVPLHPARGDGTALHAAGPLQVVESDATDYYTDRYDAKEVARTSLLVDGRYAVSLDRFRADTPHRLTWQAFTWPGAAARDGGVDVDAGAQVRFTLRPATAAETDLTPVPEFPRSPTQGSTRVRFHLPAPTADTRFAVALVPQPLLREERDLSEGWRVERNGALFADDADLRTFYLGDDSANGDTLTFTRTVELDKAPAARAAALRLRFGGDTLACRVNGHELKPAYPQRAMELEGLNQSFAQVFLAGDAFRAGSNEVELSTRTFHGESLKGPLALLADTPPLPVAFDRLDDHRYTVRIGPREDHLLIGSDGERDWDGVRSDARHAVRTEAGDRAFAGATSIDDPGREFSLRANLPVDAALAGDRLCLGALRANAVVVIRWGSRRLLVRAGRVLRLSQRADQAWGVDLDLPREADLVVNGVSHGQAGGRHGRRVALELEPPAPAPSAGPADPAAMYALSETPPADLEERVLHALEHGEWPLQVAAADVAGEWRIEAAAPHLLRLFDQEDEDVRYPPVEHSWAFSKMNTTLRGERDFSVDASGDAVRRAKRFRLKRAVTTALGRLGVQEAVPKLEAAMTRGTDFFPALAQIPIALGRLGSPSSVPVLEAQRDNAEVNTARQVRLALRYLKGEISRPDFEGQVNPDG